MPSDPRYALTSGKYAATVSAVGAALVSLRFDGRDLAFSLDSDGYPEPRYRGAVLAPWPNRIANGRYRWDGSEQQAPVNEVERGCALHGLLAWTTWQVERADADHVVLTDTVWPQPGYPFTVAVEAAYRLSEDGLSIELSASNRGRTAAPLGLSLHPYLMAPGSGVEEWTFRLEADTVLDVDPDRLLPRARKSVSGTSFDFRTGRRIAHSEIDHAFTDLAYAPDGTASATVADEDGNGVRMTWDQRSRWVQVHTTDLPGSRVHRRCLAVEPMTCPPDAFNSGTDLLRLEPGQSAAWACSLSALGD